MAQTTEIYPHIDHVRLTKSITFTGAAGLGDQGAVPLFTVTGVVEVVSLVPVCTTNLAGESATLALGVTGATTLFIAATTATDIIAGDIWVDASPAEVGGAAIAATLKNIAVRADIIGTVGTADLTGGAMDFHLLYRPLSDDGLVVAA